MDHEVALKNQAVERYFLGEMKPEERDAFEEHFFQCESCSEDVQATSAFLDNARSVLKERRNWPQPARKKRPWFRPSIAFASVAALCLVFIGYQNMTVIPALKAPRSLTAGVILDGATRSGLPSLHEREALHFQMPWDRHGPAFVELLSGSKVLSSGSVAEPEPHQPLDVYFPGTLKPGHYRVEARPLDDGQPIDNDFDVIP